MNNCPFKSFLPSGDTMEPAADTGNTHRGSPSHCTPAAAPAAASRQQEEDAEADTQDRLAKIQQYNIEDFSLGQPWPNPKVLRDHGCN